MKPLLVKLANFSEFLKPLQRKLVHGPESLKPLQRNWSPEATLRGGVLITIAWYMVLGVQFTARRRAQKQVPRVEALLTAPQCSVAWKR